MSASVGAGEENGNVDEGEKTNGCALYPVLAHDPSLHARGDGEGED